MASTTEQAIIARKYLVYLTVKLIAVTQALNSLSTVADRAMLLGLQDVCRSSIDSMCALEATKDYLISTKTLASRDAANVVAGMIVLDFEYTRLLEQAGGSARVWERVTEPWVSKMIEGLKGKIEVLVGVGGVFG